MMHKIVYQSSHYNKLEVIGLNVANTTWNAGSLYQIDTTAAGGGLPEGMPLLQEICRIWNVARVMKIRVDLTTTTNAVGTPVRWYIGMTPFNTAQTWPTTWQNLDRLLTYNKQWATVKHGSLPGGGRGGITRVHKTFDLAKTHGDPRTWRTTDAFVQPCAVPMATNPASMQRINIGMITAADPVTTEIWGFRVKFTMMVRFYRTDLEYT